jgi:hypothetical protein
VGFAFLTSSLNGTIYFKMVAEGAAQQYKYRTDLKTKNLN